MSAITIVLELLDGDVLNLAGCERVADGDEGELTLTFVEGASGLATLTELAARDLEEVTGTMTATGPGQNTEYNCALVRLDGAAAVFQLVCLD